MSLKRSLLPECAALAIGTVPHVDAGEAVDFVLEYKPACPSWPQLSQADFKENMYVQFVECMPAVRIDESGRRAFFDVEHAPDEMAIFYELLFEGNADFCGIGPEFARGFHEFLKKPLPQKARFIKGQVTGPCSFGLTMTDADGKPVLYHDDLFEALIKALALKGRWQVEQFRKKAPGLQPVIFFDEPYLTQVGSALISLSPSQVSEFLNECYAAVDGLTGTHVCGGTDWGLLASTDVDILHFDAADHVREFLLYEKEIAAFMERGGMLAWGIVPTNEQAFDLTAADAVCAVVNGAEKVAGFGPAGLTAEDVLRRSFISEACGTGSLSIGLAQHCFSLTAEISDELSLQIC